MPSSVVFSLLWEFGSFSGSAIIGLSPGVITFVAGGAPSFDSLSNLANLVLELLLVAEALA